jgi:DNA topoisomerase-3
VSRRKNICERNYVQVHAGRTVVPTPLGITLIRGYQRIDPDLCLPLMRNHVEKQIDLVAKGEADFRMVVRHTVAELLKKFQFFTRNIGRMDELFQVGRHCLG